MEILSFLQGLTCRQRSWTIWRTGTGAGEGGLEKKTLGRDTGLSKFFYPRGETWENATNIKRKKRRTSIEGNLTATIFESRGAGKNVTEKLDGRGVSGELSIIRKRTGLGNSIERISGGA